MEIKQTEIVYKYVWHYMTSKWVIFCIRGNLCDEKYTSEMKKLVCLYVLVILGVCFFLNT